jgi:hypothetical protein
LGTSGLDKEGTKNEKKKLSQKEEIKALFKDKNDKNGIKRLYKERMKYGMKQRSKGKDKEEKTNNYTSQTRLSSTGS